MAAACVLPLCSSSQNLKKTRTKIYEHVKPTSNFSLLVENRKVGSLNSFLVSKRSVFSHKFSSVSGRHQSQAPVRAKDYEFFDGSADVELRIDITAMNIQGSSGISVDVDDNSLLVRVKASGSFITLMEVPRLFERIKPAETIWYIDEDQLVINLKKFDMDVKWPDIMESWTSLATGVLQLLKGTTIYLVGDSTDINQKVAGELAASIGYTPLSTRELLERYAQQSIESWESSEGADSVAEAEGVVLESLSSHVRAVVATLGGVHGAAKRSDKWRHLHAGFTIWLSKSEAADEGSAKEEARRNMRDGSFGYTNADVVVKLRGWESDHTRVVAQACLSALKQLLLSDKQLAGKKSLYIRLGCRGDWPNIKPPGWDTSSGIDPSSES